MKKINNIALRNFYESYSFIMPKDFNESRGYIHSQMNNWSLLDSYTYTKNLKQTLSFLNKLVKNNTKKNKILFILDKSVYNFFEGSLKTQHFVTNDIKSGMEFLQRSDYSSLVAGVVYIGKYNNMSLKILQQMNVPFFCFTPKSKSRSNFDYCNYNMLAFHGSIVYLKLLFKEILATNTNAKKKI